MAETKYEADRFRGATVVTTTGSFSLDKPSSGEEVSVCFSFTGSATVKKSSKCFFIVVSKTPYVYVLYAKELSDYRLSLSFLNSVNKNREKVTYDGAGFYEDFFTANWVLKCYRTLGRSLSKH